MGAELVKNIAFMNTTVIHHYYRIFYVILRIMLKLIKQVVAKLHKKTSIKGAIDNFKRYDSIEPTNG